MPATFATTKTAAAKPTAAVRPAAGVALQPAASPRPRSACACGGRCPRCGGGASALRMGRRDDVHEREADRVAARALSGAAPAPASALPAPTGERAAPSIVERAIATPGRPLDRTQRGWFEPRLGRSLADVRVHDDAFAAQSARAIAARAYTVGQHIVFGAGQYDAHSAGGRALLAHELAHTAQTAHGVVRRKPLTPEERTEDLQSPELRDDARLQEAFDNAPDMHKYESSDGVRTLQRRLRELDYALPVSFAKTGDADGIYGDETEGVVKDFQREHGLVPTGVAERDTLRELDLVFDPLITIEKVYFGEDHRQLIDNEVDWEDTGARYADWSHAPYHVVFTPGELLAESIPLSVSGGVTMSAMAWVNIRGGVPGRNYTVRARSSDVGWSLSGTGTHRKGETRDLVFLAADAALGKQFAKLQALQFWETVSTAATRSNGMSMSTVFVTAGPVADAEREIKSDHPFVPTRKRLEQAMNFATGSDITQADRIIWKVMREFPAYGVCDAPTRRRTSISCPDIVSVWGMSPYIETGAFQCITVARYADAVFHILGIRSAVPDAVAEPVVVWADLEHRDGEISPWPHSGISEGGVRRHPIHRSWRLGLIDGHCGVNNFEACERLTWTPPGKSEPVVQIWCGGLGENNPRQGFRTARQVLANVFTLAWYTPMSKPDPKSGFPRGIIERDEENYRGIFHCNRDLGRDER